MKKKQIEIWKNIPNFDGIYQVSNLGRIRSVDKYIEVESNNQFVNYTIVKKIEGRILKQNKMPCGYLKVNLRKDRKEVTKRVHRLVAEAFIPNPKNLPQVNHKDCNRLNNNVDNLEWVTAKENSIYSVLYGARKPKLLECEEEIYQKLIKGKTVRELAEEYNVSTMPIMNIKRKRGLI